MKKALILGIKGQDGSLLAKHLLKKNYVVTGISRTKLKNQNLPGLMILGIRIVALKPSSICLYYLL